MSRPTKSDLRRSVETSLDLLTAPTEAGRFPIRELPNAHTTAGAVLVGFDAAQRWHLLLPVGDGHPVPEDRESRGIHVGPREFIDSSERRQFIDITCVMPRLRRLFTILVTDVLERVLDDPGRPDVAVSNTLAEWRDLLARATNRVDEARLRAVFSELHQLRELTRVESTLSRAWRGPDNEPHDIEHAGLAIEVKSRRRPGKTIIISGIDQLEIPTDGELVLVVHTVDRDESGESLADVVESIAAAGGDRPHVLDGLAKLGIDSDEELTGALRFSTRDEFAYRVTDDFPRLVGADLVVGHLHPSIRSITYTIDLSSAASSLMTTDELQAYRRRMAER